MTRILFVIFILIASSALSQTYETEAWSRWRVLEAGAAQGDPVPLSALEVWRLDCSAESGELIGKIRGVASGQNGKTLLLDSQLTQVVVVDTAGEIERVFGQPGEGPGDFPGAFRAFELPNGHIGVVGGAEPMTFMMGSKGEISLFDTEGNPAGRWRAVGEAGLTPIATIRELRCAAGHLLVAGDAVAVSQEGMTRIQELNLIDTDIGERRVLARRTYQEDMSSRTIGEGDFFDVFAYGRCDVSSTGRLAFAPDRDIWKIVVGNPDGTGFILEKTWDPVPRSKERKKEIQGLLGGPGIGVPLDHEPALGRIRWRPDGRLWVESRGYSPRPFEVARFDEFSPDGRHLREVSVRWEGLEPEDAPVFLENGKVAVMRGFVSGGDETEESEEGGWVILLDIQP